MAVVAVIAIRQPGKKDASAPAPTTVSGAPSTTPSPSSPRVSPSTTPRTSPSRSTTTSPTTSPSPTTSVAVKSIPLVVLNNTTTSGLAASARQRFEAGGWTVTSSGNLDNTIISTCAYYDPSVNGAKAAALALQRQYPTIKRVEQKFPQLPAGPVVVVLTPDYSPN